MRSDTSQGGDCGWAFATAVYSRTSERSGMCRLWYSLYAWFLIDALIGLDSDIWLRTDWIIIVPHFSMTIH